MRNGYPRISAISSFFFPPRPTIKFESRAPARKSIVASDPKLGRKSVWERGGPLAPFLILHLSAHQFDDCRRHLPHIKFGPRPPIPLQCPIMITFILLFISNIFMTAAWYGHLKYPSESMIFAIVSSWLIAFGEYCFQVPANRIGYGQFTAYQLKIIQEVITLIVFVVFAFLYLGEQPRWNYVASFGCILAAVAFAFGPALV